GQLSSDRSHVSARAAEAKGGRARNDEEIGEGDEGADDVFNDPVGEVAVAGANVVFAKRKHRDGGPVSPRARTRSWGSARRRLTCFVSALDRHDARHRRRLRRLRRGRELLNDQDRKATRLNFSHERISY